MIITEPATLLTDYILAAISLWAAVPLLRIAGSRGQLSPRLWAIGFVAVAVAAITGGTFHGLRLYFDASMLRSLWNVTVFLIGVSAAFMISGVLTSSIRRTDESAKSLLIGVALTLVALAVQQSGVRPHANFNHNDVSHVIQMGAFYLFFRGARLLEDR